MARSGSPDGDEFTTPDEGVALVALQVMTTEDKEAKSRSLAPPQHAQDRRASGTPGYSPAQKMRANFHGMTAWGGSRLRPNQLANRDAAWKAALQKRTARENGGEGAQIKRGRAAGRAVPAPPPPSAGSVPRQRRP